jgi:hypothetical protein
VIIIERPTSTKRFATRAKTIELLEKARDHIAAPYGWARDGSLAKPHRRAPHGTALCAIGAIHYYSKDNSGLNAQYALYKTLLREHQMGSIAEFNDSSITKQPVIDLFNSAIEEVRNG